MPARATVCLTFDFDAVALWLTTFRATSPSAISRGEFGARVGLPRVLDLLDARGVAATFFVPGATAELYPDAVRAIRAAGHEVAAHGDRHERHARLDDEAERAVIRRGAQVIEQVIGAAPLGFRSPNWELGPNSIAILEELGFRYDSSMMADDFRPYRPRAGDRISDDGQLVPGRESRLWELPVAWELDDFPYFCFHPYPYYVGTRTPDEVYQLWAGEFAFMYGSVMGGVFTLTLHPQLIGRGPRLAMLDRLVRHMQAHDGVRFGRLADVAAELDRDAGA